jgi:hypothetical protein
VGHVQMLARVAVASVLAELFPSPVHATSWRSRKDVGVATVDMRTGKVLWEARRLGEVPAGTSKEEKAAVEYLLASAENPGKPLPPEMVELADRL